MPHIIVRIPKDSYPGEARAALVRGINEAAALAEQIPADPRKRMLCWVLIDEAASGAWTCGGADLSAQLLPCVAWVYLPQACWTTPRGPCTCRRCTKRSSDRCRHRTRAGSPAR